MCLRGCWLALTFSAPVGKVVFIVFISVPPFVTGSVFAFQSFSLYIHEHFVDCDFTFRPVIKFDTFIGETVLFLQSGSFSFWGKTEGNLETYSTKT